MMKQFPRAYENLPRTYESSPEFLHSITLQRTAPRVTGVSSALVTKMLLPGSIFNCTRSITGAFAADDSGVSSDSDPSDSACARRVSTPGGLTHVVTSVTI